MIETICPVPNKKQRITPEGSDNEDLNLSEKFDEDYRMLMNEEILKNCKQSVCSNDPIEPSEVLPNFLNRCEELSLNMKDILGNRKWNNQCRCDKYLQKYEKVLHIKRLFESPRFTNITVLANLLMTNDKNLAATVQSRLDEIHRVWDSKDLELDGDLAAIISDINADINDLRSGIQATDEKLNVQIDGSQIEYVQCLETVLKGCKVHNGVSNSVSRTIEKVIDLDSQMIFNEAICECQIKLEELTKSIHGQWLKALEFKLKLEAIIDGVHQYKLGPCLLGPESGFESEISPMNPARGLPRNDITIMKYISSSGECLFDNNTTDFPMDSESTEFSPLLNLTEYKSDSSSLVGTMLEQPVRYHTGDEDVKVRKKHRRLKKRRQHLLRPGETHSEKLSPKEKEKYLQICNAFSRQSNSLKRRINDTSIVDSVNKTDATSSRISDLAAAAEKIVMKIDVNKRNNSCSESPKESENEDGDNILVCSANELNLREVWDNYQASLYSNDDGDSEYVEVDKIRDWEQDLETDDQGLEMCPNDITLPMLTSGYETSMESEMHFCNKNLIIILQYSANEKCEVSKRIDHLTREWDSATSLAPDKVEGHVNELLTKSNFHIKLLNQILMNDPCGGTQLESLMKQLELLQNEWEEIIRKCLIFQSKADRQTTINRLDQFNADINQINYRISKFNTYTDLIGLESSIRLLRESKNELASIRQVVDGIGSARTTGMSDRDVRATIANIQENEQEIDALLTGCENDDVIQSCAALLKESQTNRMRVESKFKDLMTLEVTEDWETLSYNSLGILQTSKEALETSLGKLAVLSSQKPSEILECDIRKELKQLDDLQRRLKVALPLIEDLRSKIDCLTEQKKSLEKLANPHKPVCGFLNRLPVQVTIFVLIVMCGLWYKNQSSSLCQGSVDWFRLFRKYTNNMEPH